MYNKDTMQWEGYIYKISNDINDKLYIGQTQQTLDRRFSDHIRCANGSISTMVLHKEMRKIGVEHFYISSIEFITAKSSKELSKRLNVEEHNYISKLNTLQPNGYNYSVGRGSHPAQKIYHYSYNGDLLNVFVSVKSASENTGLAVQTIIDCCNGRAKSTKCGVFVYEKNVISGNVKIPKRYSNVVPLNVFDINGNLVTSFSSIMESEQELKLSYTQIWIRANTHRIFNDNLVIFKYNEVFDKKIIIQEDYQPLKKQVDEYTCDGEYVRTYNSISEASLISGYTKGYISVRCNNPNKPPKNKKRHYFKFHNYDFESA